MKFLSRTIAALLLTGVCAPLASATRIKDLCEIQGARENGLRGFGLVVGLAGTGDKVEAAKLAQEQVLNRLQIEVNELDDIKSDNVAFVFVSATMPAFAKEGTRIDAHVQSFYDAESLEGGTLVETMLYGPDNSVYALAQGPVSVGGFNADGGGGTSARKNHVTVGRVPMGAYVEREVPSRITDGERIMLLLKNPDFGTARNITEIVNQQMPASASAFGAGTVSVTIPAAEQRDLVTFIAKVLDLEVEADEGAARVVINERTGTIVVGGNVRIRPCQVAHGGLTITVAVTPIVSQPIAPFTDGETEVVELTEVTTEEVEAQLMPLEGVSAAEVAEGLNRLKVTPRDMIAIFQALRRAGVMDADLELM